METQAKTEITRGDFKDSVYGQNTVFVPAGEIVLTGSIGPARAQETLAIKAGETIVKASRRAMKNLKDARSDHVKPLFGKVFRKNPKVELKDVRKEIDDIIELSANKGTAEAEMNRIKKLISVRKRWHLSTGNWARR